jgi:hypothetical protein
MSEAVVPHLLKSTRQDMLQESADKLFGRELHDRKAGELTGEARIGRVTFSRTGKTIYYRGKAFQSLGGRGFKANYFETESGEEYWISGPRKDGSDRLYGERVAVEIDDDVRDEYWAVIRGMPENKTKKVAD